MDYNIIMPQLSDSMSEGKLVEWKVKEGDQVKSGDVIADIESDKAVIEVQTFKDGVVKKLLLKEGEEAKVGSVIAIIDTDGKVSKEETKSKAKEEETIAQPPKNEQISQKKREDVKEDIIDILFDKDLSSNNEMPKGVATPVAKQKAKKYGIDLEKLQKDNKAPKPAYEKDIDKIIKKRYFTPKALKLLDEYALKIDMFKLDHKINSGEIKQYLIKNNIPKIVTISSNRKSVIKTISNSWKKPIYHIFEEVEIEKKEGIKLTAQLLKALANSMQRFPFSRSILRDEKFEIYPSSNISVALSKEDSLYMVVLKNAQLLTLSEINSWLKEIKNKKLSLDDLKGSTFGISNLGMFGIDSFDALINEQDSGIVAFGSLKEGKIKVVFTFDHRVVNGAEAARFVTDFKEELKSV